MSLPPHTIGDHNHVVLVEPVERRRWSVTIDGRTLPPRFRSEPEARAAAATETERLEGIAFGLLRRVRRGLRRKQ
jgi:hypothetical protein